MLRWALAIGRTPRELLAAVSSEDITEMMAFAQDEPFGALHLEAVVGSLCALTANVHWKKKDGGQFIPTDFMPKLAASLGVGQPDAAANDEALLDDPAAQADLIKRMVFKFGSGGNG